tara:strand:+ start:38 stop:244 length:207 start_codon:yes stop_codon:yes gene_type:complete
MNKNNQAIESRDMKGGSAILINTESRNKEKPGFKKPACSLHDSVQCKTLKNTDVTGLPPQNIPSKAVQ